jgi:hypothetical protein
MKYFYILLGCYKNYSLDIKGNPCTNKIYIKTVKKVIVNQINNNI